MKSKNKTDFGIMCVTYKSVNVFFGNQPFHWQVFLL